MNIENMITRNPRGKCLARPGLSLTLYSDESLHALAPAICSLLIAYLNQVGDDVLQTCFNDEGQARPLSSAILNRDKKRLLSVAESTKAIILEYGSDPEGWVGEYGFSFYGADFSHYLYDEERANYLRLDFPFDFLERSGLDAFLDFVGLALAMAPIHFANAGFTFQRSSATSNDATRAVNRLLPRYAGFDPGFKNAMDYMRGHAFMAHWLTFLGPGLVASVGGSSQIEIAVQGAEVRTVGGGLLIRAACYPPLGDVNQGALDMGLIPAVSRLLEPVRAGIEAFGEPTTKFDGAAWIKRLDGLATQPWDNVVFYKTLMAQP